MHLSILLLVILTVLHHAHAQQQVQLSLEGGPDSNSGRVVVIWYGSTRGTICSDGFDNEDAAVICRILGKSSNGAVARSFGAGSGTIIMSRLGCRGHEQGLLDCPVGSWAPRTGCQHSQDAGVVCGGSSPQVTSAPFTQRPRPNPTPGPAAGCRDSFLVRQNRVAPNAGRFPALTTTACSDACLASNPTCYGYDWRGACYINLNSSNLQVGTGTNYERIFSCRTSAPPANGPGSCRDRFITYQNQYVVNGAFVQTSSTQDCANKCLQSSLRCRGYGIWDRIWCFLVLYTHSGNDVVFDSRWTRYQRVFTCPGSGPTPTPSPSPVFTPSPPRLAPVQAFLVDGTDYLHGRVVLQYNGVNGTVCDDSFDYNDARVICRMLRYFGSDVSAAGNTFGAGPSSMRIWLDDLACRGTERDVSACSHRGWGSHNCGHREDVSVVCGRRVFRDPPVRVALQGGSDRLHGRLVVAYNNQPGTVCNDNFRTDDARVVCRMLGYRGSSVSVTSRYGPGSGRIWLDEVFCHGNESSISDCFYPPLGTHDCSHSDDVGINCGLTTITTPPTVPRTTPAPPTVSFILEGSGRVALRLNGIRGYICSDGFGLNDARVVCRSFGRPSTNAQIRNFPHTSGIVWLTNVQCTGFESRIDQCRFDAEVVITNCRSGQNIGVVCGTSQFPTTRRTPPRPTPGPTLPPSGSAPFCSRFGSKIYGGVPAQQRERPEIVKVQASKDGLTTHCGGSIISREWILTSAACLFRYKSRRPTILIIAGTTNLQRGGVRVLANGFIVHPSYRNGSNTHDVAVIRLGRLLNLGTSIRPVCLNTVRNAIPAGDCYTAGWGRLRQGQTTRTQILQTTRYPIVSDSQCRHFRGYNNDALICAGFSSGSATICPGDAGSPLGCFVGNSFSQWGIASNAVRNSCGGPNAQVTTWTEVAQYVSWIRSNTGL